VQSVLCRFLPEGDCEKELESYGRRQQRRCHFYLSAFQCLVVAPAPPREMGESSIVLLGVLMEIVNSVLYGFSISLLPINILHCLIGVFIGTLVGVLPGLGPTASISILLPITFQVSSPVSALIMLSGLYYGVQYGGSITSILVNIPGEASTVVTCLDGHQMARKGRAGPALGITAFGSFIAGTLGVVGLMLVAPTLARYALKFGPPEYCALMLLGFTILSYVARGSTIKAFMMAGLGLIIGTVGMDMVTGVYRFSFGVLALEDGLGMVPVIMGLFGISEVMLNIEKAVIRGVFEEKLKGLYPSRQDWKDSIRPIGRGTLLGFCIGVLPGAGPMMSSFMAYIVEKRVSKHPERFGQGEIAGVAGPEGLEESLQAVSDNPPRVANRSSARTSHSWVFSTRRYSRLRMPLRLRRPMVRCASAWGGSASQRHLNCGIGRKKSAPRQTRWTDGEPSISCMSWAS